MNNPYLPKKAEIFEIIQETSSDLDIKTFKLKFTDGSGIEFAPGQFLELSIPGVGEAPFGFASSPLNSEYLELSVKRVGAVTEALHGLKAGSTVWLRGPFGNTFPMKEMQGSKLLVVAGGLGLAPLRPLILYVLNAQNRNKYGDVKMLLAARGPGDFIYRPEFTEWDKVQGTEIIKTIDKPEDGWNEKVGFPHILVGEMDIDVLNSYAVLCGPPIMIKFVSGRLIEMGIPKEKIFTTLEMRMTCGIGKCGKCNIGREYVCINGPVFSMAQLSNMPGEY